MRQSLLRGSRRPRLLPRWLVGPVAVALTVSVLAVGSLPAAAKGTKVPKPKPVGTTFDFPDTGNTFVDVTLLRVVNHAPAKGHYSGLVGKGPVVALEFSMKNISASPASLSLFSSVLYYSSGVIALTKNLGATKLGPSLNTATPLNPGAHRQGWLTVQAVNKRLLKIQSTLNGTNTGTWAG
ncbi:MAG TPA: hypothetical protein VL961_06340 [Acidimicrobiales bacterium]|nr:hypothetical protein [Acidimicrobiales bacterium]